MIWGSCLGEIDVIVAIGWPIVIATGITGSVVVPYLTVMVPDRVEFTTGVSKADAAKVTATLVPQE